jgi:hypothetical protein
LERELRHNCLRDGRPDRSAGAERGAKHRPSSGRADRLLEDPDLVGRARARLDAWLSEGLIHPVYGEAWRRLLTGPLDRLLDVLTRDDDDARALRQSSPFAGVLDPQTRWRIGREGRAAK